MVQQQVTHITLHSGSRGATTNNAHYILGHVVQQQITHITLHSGSCGATGNAHYVTFWVVWCKPQATHITLHSGQCGANDKSRTLRDILGRVVQQQVTYITLHSGSCNIFQ